VKEGQEKLKPLVFEINGEQFKNRAPDRAKKSFKMHNQPDL
jgi:ribonuclease P protein subunit POP4